MFAKVLVVGGGVAGMRAALDLARDGVPVVLVDKEPIVGGSMAARLNDEAETFDLACGAGIPKTSQVAAEKNIEIMTLSQVVGLSGEPGRFRVTIRQRGRIVTDACTQCNRCRQACPVVVPNEFESGLTYRKAIYQPLKQAVPATYVINIEDCLNDPPNYMPCRRCVEVCDDNAIRFDAPLESTREIEVGAVIVATGYQLADSAPIREYGYGVHEDIVTSIELERLLSPYGPTGGYLEKPSSEESVSNVLFVMRDQSQFSWACVAAQTARLAQQDVETVSILHTQQEFDERFRTFWQHAASPGARLICGRLSSLGMKEDGSFRIRYEDARLNHMATIETELVVFNAAVEPSPETTALAGILGIELSESGFIAIDKQGAGVVGTSRPGVYVCGCASGAKDMPDSIAEAKATAIYASRHLDSRLVEANVNFAPEHNDKSGVVINGRWLTPDEFQRRIQASLLSMLGN